MDDQLLLDEQDPSVVDRHMRRFRALGVDRLRVSAFWDQIAPRPGSTQKPPHFNAASPMDPGYNFANLDRVVQSARPPRAQGDDLDHHAGAAAGRPGNPARDDRQWKPKPDEFALFARAIAARYGPEADQFAILNEPNQPGWLQPQSNKRGFYAPHHYRRLVNAAFPAIRAGEPGRRDPRGRAGGQRQREPRARLRDPPARVPAGVRLRRRARSARSAPGPCRGFRTPRADAIGHHPYQFFMPPGSHSPHRDDAAIGDGPRLLRFLDRLVGRGGLVSARGGKLDVHYTEFGYQTDPPDPYAGIPLKRQDRWLQEAARIAWATPRVHTYSQFRLTDGPVLPGRRIRRLPRVPDRPHVPRHAHEALLRRPSGTRLSIKRRGKRLRLWGQVRPGGRHDVDVERKRRGGWKQVADRHDDPARLLAAQDPQALGHLPLPLGLRRAAHERQRPRRLAAPWAAARFLAGSGDFRPLRVRTFTNTCSPPPSSAFV